MTSVRPLTIGIFALGGQGGGVLAEWILAVAEAEGYIAQSTSVPGVAQRTGATVYYIEVFPGTEVAARGREPVLALMPNPGDLDVAIASELAEAGRAVLRRVVTPDRTTLIASTHRIYAIGEKTAMGDGRVDSSVLIARAEAAAKRFIGFDMDALAQSSGSVISAVLLGAVAASGALPFARESYEGAIRHGGIGVEASLRAFAAAFDRTRANGHDAAAVGAPASAPAAPALVARSPAGQKLLDRVAAEFPPATHPVVVEGVRRVVDYQNPAYGQLYLDRLAKIRALDDAPSFRLTSETARYLALWMTYEDTIRVADLKTRASRAARVREEVRAREDQLVYTVEFMHPRVQEICETMPWFVGGPILRTAWLRKALEPMFSRGRHVHSGKLSGFLLLYVLAALRPTRPWSLRHRTETKAIEDWLARIAAAAPKSYGLAVEIAECQRLVKGYGDTHARGSANYEKIMAALGGIGTGADAPARVHALREAALADESGKALAAALAG